MVCGTIYIQQQYDNDKTTKKATQNCRYKQCKQEMNKLPSSLCVSSHSLSDESHVLGECMVEQPYSSSVFGQLLILSSWKRSF